jgi:DNA invertase Pin-like site-specific DNA recombinase
MNNMMTDYKNEILTRYLSELSPERRAYYKYLYTLLENKAKEGAISKYRLINFQQKVDAKLLYEVGFTLIEIGKLLSVSYSTVSRYINYDLNPKNIVERGRYHKSVIN